MAKNKCITPNAADATAKLGHSSRRCRRGVTHPDVADRDAKRHSQAGSSVASFKRRTFTNGAGTTQKPFGKR